MLVGELIALLSALDPKEPIMVALNGKDLGEPVLVQTEGKVTHLKMGHDVPPVEAFAALLGGA